MNDTGSNFADETYEMASESGANPNAEPRKRRSTRIVQAVPLVGKIAARIVHANRRRTSAFLTSRYCSPPRYFEAELRGLPSEVGLRFVPTRNMQTSRATQIGPTSK